MSELSAESGVPVATIKYYLREGLLHDGERVSKTRASYDAAHVGRLNLIRALIGVGGLGVQEAKAVLDEIDGPPESLHELIGSAYTRLPPVVAPAGAEPDRALELLRELGWDEAIQECTPDVAGLDRALRAVEAADLGLTRADLIAYGRAMEAVAGTEVAATPAASLTAAVRYVVLGTVLVEPVLLSLRRLAHVEESARLLGGGG